MYWHFIIVTIKVIQSPKNLHLLEGSVAYFPCTSSNGYLPYWRINGQLYGLQFLPNGFFYNASGLIVNHVFLSQNGTTIQCVFSADVTSDVVILTVYSNEKTILHTVSYKSADTSQQTTLSTIADSTLPISFASIISMYDLYELSSFYDTSITTSISMIILSSSTQNVSSSSKSTNVMTSNSVTPVTGTESRSLNILIITTCTGKTNLKLQIFVIMI